ncbi:MAG TPA: single-stranded-DNA-specific exonuclease RecJ [Dissulfurispiraceae bacterium]|nr:single-stranded-DNA-specific exonuclease RecJ [Dissulfurispiraceae bacterium]
MNGAACRWVVNRTNPEFISYFSRIADLSPVLAQILVNRGINTPALLAPFLKPGLAQLSDSFDLPGLNIALGRIAEAKQRGERVLVHGDYDADGVTATAIMVEGLRSYGLDVHFFIPNRMLHGYGFNHDGVRRAREIGASLIVTVDYGITSFDAVCDAGNHGIDVIITDHHEPAAPGEHAGADGQPFVIPPALSVVNPRLLAGESPLRLLSGAGVAFHLIYALFKGDTDRTFHLLDLAALGTMADVVPVIADNRVLVHEGMKLIGEGRRAGLRALKDVAGLRRDRMRSSDLAYVLVPRLNAAGRMDDATTVVELLLSVSEEKAAELAAWLNALNVRRQEVEEKVYREAQEMMERLDDRAGAIVLASEGWHQGVVGIVASRIAEEFYRPTFILSVDNGVARGSGRSIPPFDLHDALIACRHVLAKFGGHRQAAGVSLDPCRVEEFRQMLSGILAERVGQDDLSPVLRLDSVVKISDISRNFIREISMLEPFGHGNEEPLFGARGLDVLNCRVVGNRHLKMYLKQDGWSIDGIAFNMGDRAGDLGGRARIDAAFCPAIHTWDGKEYLQLQVKAIRPSAER